MRIIILSLVTVGWLGGAPAQAQTPDSENGRYSFHQVTEGTLRLDSRTGQVSLCARQGTSWNCAAVPDDRAALENEIARLQRENGTLKKELLARNVPLPGGVTGQLPSSRELQLKMPLPSDAEIDRMMTVFEKMWRRLIDTVKSEKERI